MGEEQSHDGAVEAQHDVAHRRQAPSSHLDAIGHRLAGIAYQTAHDTDTARHENKPQQGKPLRTTKSPTS